MKKARGFRGKYFSLAAILATTATATLAAQNDSVNDRQERVAFGKEVKSEADKEDKKLVVEQITVESDRIKQNELSVSSPFELYSGRDIKNSQAKTLYEFFNSKTSVTATPSYGGATVQLLEMRGYGIEHGAQNIAVTVNGRRLGNIDNLPPMLFDIPIDAVQKIEINRGGGSVAYGDGASAGSIAIYTDAPEGVSIKSSFGSFGEKQASVLAGVSVGDFKLFADGSFGGNDGKRSFEADGSKDGGIARAKAAGFSYHNTDLLYLRVERRDSDANVKYPSYLTKAQFDSDAKQKGAYPARQLLGVNSLSAIVDAKLYDDVRLELSGFKDKKNSTYLPSEPTRYDYISLEPVIKKEEGALKFAAGVTLFDGKRATPEGFAVANETSKNSSAIWGKVRYDGDFGFVSAGARSENTKYKYETTSSNLSKKINSSAAELAYGYDITSRLGAFVSYSKAFTTPEIDSFFTYDFSKSPAISVFNGFIEPQKSDTVNIGLNHKGAAEEYKATLFATKLKNEIFLEPTTFTNTNLDKTSKKGVEFFADKELFEGLHAHLNYAFVLPKIDSENEAKGAYSGKSLPGTSKHTIGTGVEYQPTKELGIGVSHRYRSEAYAMNDFANNFSQRQKAYNSTDAGVRYEMKNYELFAAVKNIFAVKNGLWVQDDAIYPVDFLRTYSFGFKAKF